MKSKNDDKMHIKSNGQSKDAKKTMIMVKDLEKTYTSRGEHLTILKGLDMTVLRGEAVAVTGESGSGKSTLLNILCSLDKPTDGTVVCDGADATSLWQEGDAKRSQYRQSSCGMVFQFHHLLKDFTALENVFLPAIMAGVKRKEAEARAKELLCRVGLEGRMEHLPSEMSGGERQRAAIARALVNDPAIILADEPTGNLDRENAKRIGELLFDIVRQKEKTLVLATHDLSLARKADRVLEIKGGRLADISSGGGNEAADVARGIV